VSSDNGKLNTFIHISFRDFPAMFDDIVVGNRVTMEPSSQPGLKSVQHRTLRISCEHPEGSEVEVWAAKFLAILLPEKVSSNRAGNSTEEMELSIGTWSATMMDFPLQELISGGEICTLSYNIWFVFFLQPYV
jgi:hypothetical protein